MPARGLPLLRPLHGLQVHAGGDVQALDRLLPVDLVPHRLLLPDLAGEKGAHALAAGELAGDEEEHAAGLAVARGKTGRARSSNEVRAFHDRVLQDLEDLLVVLLARGPSGPGEGVLGGPEPLHDVLLEGTLRQAAAAVCDVGDPRVYVRAATTGAPARLQGNAA